MWWRGVSYAILLKGDEACLGWVGHAAKRLALEDVGTVGRLGEVAGEEVGVGIVSTPSKTPSPPSPLGRLGRSFARPAGCRG